MTDNFVHLHVHTEFSLLDGAIRVSDLIHRVKELGMSAVAMTDHGVLYGMLDFYQKAEKEGVKPIIGCEVYIAPESHLLKQGRNMYHLILLAYNKQGYHNLIKLVTKGWLDGFYYKPRVDKDLLYQHHQGLIALSSCIQGEIAQQILADNLVEAEKRALEYQQIFGRENYFLELQDHNLAEEKRVNSKIIQLSNKTGIPMVVSNDVHYLNQNDAELHDVLLALQTGKKINDEKRMSLPNDQFYLKSSREMYNLFPALEKAFVNTVSITDRCNIKLDFNTFYLPDFPAVDQNMTPFHLLREKCEKGLISSGLQDNPVAVNRLEYELSIIEQMGYVSYFLIVWDFIDYAERNGIRVGPGRGSAAGSLVSYLLGITKIDPLKYNLIFERFLNPERVTMPDIDIDFDEDRDRIINYVRERYGNDRVAQIGTFGTLAARAAIRDVGRVLDIPLNKVDRVAKLVPGRPGITIENALHHNEKLLHLYQNESEIKELLDYARSVEGLPKHISTHAAGVIIGPSDLSEIIPLQKQDESVITQLPMNDLEKLGLLKMDFLGLRNLTIINKTLELVKKRHGVRVDLDNLPLDDEKVYKLLQQGKTLGVFQMESYLFQDLNKKLKPNRFSDLIALLALGRPGPLGSNLVDQYIDSRHGKREPEYLDPALKPILEETFGLILYQEQVMEIASKLAGYSMGQADLLRRGMGKKKKELITAERERFVLGAKKRGIREGIANQIFDQMEYFSGYGFNKSHSAAYALLAYQTAYLKVKYPEEFMSALLSSVMNSQNKVGQYVRECREMGIAVLPPDVNQSLYEFTPVEDRKIRFGLKAIKNVGESAIREIIEGCSAIKYSSLEDFLKKVDTGKVNIQVVESLIKAGAFSSFQQRRSQLLIKFEEIYNQVNNGKKRHSSGQTSFFDLVDDNRVFYDNNLEYPDITELNLEEILAQEKEFLGIYLSAHPLDNYQVKIKYFTTSDSELIKEQEPDKKILSAGMVISKKEHITKRNSQMAFLTIEDWSGNIEVVVFPDLYQKNKEILKVGDKVFIKGRIDGNNIIAENIFNLDYPFLLINISSSAKSLLSSLKKILSFYPGNSPLFLRTKKGSRDTMTLGKVGINVNDELIKKVSGLLGEEFVKVIK